jgi:hypothetical protein
VATGTLALPRFLERIAATGEVIPTANANGSADAPACRGD